MSEPAAALSMWVVYDHPSDFPDWWVARRWDIVTGVNEPVNSGVVFTARTLSGLRDLLPEGLYRMDRNPQDDPAIVEVWL